MSKVQGMSVQVSSEKRAKREFSESFKAEAVRQVIVEGRACTRVARELDITESALYNWVKVARASQQSDPQALSKEEREELQALRRENKRLREEREILRKATAFFANDQR